MYIEILTAVLVVAAIVGACIASRDVARSRRELVDALDRAEVLLRAAEARMYAHVNKLDKKPVTE
jgi:hypothetical protein